jgi:diguanylate cyclase (GGDEF)-like protein
MPDQHAAGRLNLLLEVLSASARLRDAESLFRVLAEGARGLIDFERFTVVLCDDQRQIVRAVLIENQTARDVQAIELHPSDANAIRQALATATPSNGTSGLCNPMELDGRVLGLLCFVRRESYTAQECRFAHFLAEYLAGTFDRLTQGKVILRQTKALSCALDERETALAAAGALSLQMSHLAQHDVLTSLPNRLLLGDRLERAIALANRYDRRLAVLFVDLDRFKHVNDSLGHTVGDQVLRSISDRLAASVRSSDTVSRYGGDEFVVLCAELDRVEDAAVSAAKIVTAVAAALQLGGHEIHLTCSIGVSIYPDDDEDGDALIRSADTAMYHAKACGGNAYRFFKVDMNARAVERQFVEEGLRRALERHEFVLHYQPKVDLETGIVIGAEALIRWRHPDRGLVPPAQFVSIAEECGLIVPIGQWVLREACRQARAWQDAGLPRLSVSVNLSAIEFRSRTFLADVCRVLEETRLEARYLELELTESVLMDHSEAIIDMLQALKTMGVQLAIDDFGTGYSSLSYLTQLPIDALKVDQSFVRQLVPDAHGAFKIGPALIVSAVIGMGKSLRHRVIAEGVETREQLAFLQAQHCGEAQGFYFSRPLGADQFARVLQNGAPQYLS